MPALLRIHEGKHQPALAAPQGPHSQDASTQTALPCVFNSGTPIFPRLPGSGQQGHVHYKGATKIPTVIYRPIMAFLYSSGQALSKESGLSHTGRRLTRKR